MKPLAIILIGCGVIIMALHSLNLRWLVGKREGGRQIIGETQMLTIQFAVTFVLLTPFIFFWDSIIAYFAVPIHPNPTWFWRGVVITTVANVVIQYAGARAMAEAHGAVPLVAPIQALTPGLITITALFLGERLSSLGWIALFLISGGVYVHARWEANAKTLYEWLLPLAFWIWFLPHRGLSEEEKSKRRALRWSYLGAVFGAAGLLGDGLSARHGNLPLAFAIQACVIAVVYALATSLTKSSWHVDKKAVINLKFNPVWLVMLLGALFAAHIFTVQTAFMLSPIAVIGTLKRVRIIVEVPLARLILGEKEAFGRRLWVAIAVTIGAIILALDDKSPAVFSYLKR